MGGTQSAVSRTAPALRGDDSRRAFAGAEGGFCDSALPRWGLNRREAASATTPGTSATMRGLRVCANACSALRVGGGEPRVLTEAEPRAAEARSTENFMLIECGVVLEEY